MTYEEYKQKRATLTERQIEWLNGKAQWEQMTPWAVMNNWTVPDHAQLNDDGSWRGEE